jgi:uncharacterized cupin superfamily protein
VSQDGALDVETASPLQLLRLPNGIAASSATVATFLRAQGAEPYSWSNGPGDRYAVHEHSFTKLLMCAAGSVTFELGGGGAITLRPGDGFVLPPGTQHSAVVGPQGCTCLEGHRQIPG